LQSYKFQCELTFLTDVTDHLNQLNLRLQGKNQNIANLFDEYVIGFWKKLELFISSNKKKNNFTFFVAEIQTEYFKVNFSQFHNNLSILLYNFNTRFEDFELIKTKIELFISTLTVRIDEQQSDLQLELYDLQSNMYFTTIKETGKNFF